MNRPTPQIEHAVLLLVTLVLVAACATGGAPEPPTLPAPDRAPNLIDPRTGIEPSTIDPVINRIFARGWRAFIAGDITTARTAFREALAKDSQFAPAALALAAIELDLKRTDNATEMLKAIEPDDLETVAARVYRAEIARERGDIRAAIALYDALASTPGAPEWAGSRAEELRQTLATTLADEALRTADASRAIELARESLAARNDRAMRIYLAKKLIEVKRLDEARNELQKLQISGDADSKEVQELLAEIEIARGRYQEAIRRLEKLARDYPGETRFEEKLRTAKRRWHEANLPPQYHAAASSRALTRSELAVLMYWQVSAVRFARPSQIPIVVDIGGVDGREEFIRALGLGLFPVDRVTREASPERIVTPERFVRIVSDLLALGTPPACIASVPPESRGSLATLQACGIPALALARGGESVSGAAALTILDAVDQLLRN